MDLIGREENEAQKNVYKQGEITIFKFRRRVSAYT